jgi:hypothetical protein
MASLEVRVIDGQVPVQIAELQRDDLVNAKAQARRPPRLQTTHSTRPSAGGVRDALECWRLQALTLTFYERDRIAGTQQAQIHCTAPKAMLEKLPGDVAVALDRCGCERLLILKMPLEVSGQILSRGGRDMGGGTNTPSAQELQKLCNRVPLDLSSRSTMRRCRCRQRSSLRSICASPKSANLTRRFASQRSNII